MVLNSQAASPFTSTAAKIIAKTGRRGIGNAHLNSEYGMI